MRVYMSVCMHVPCGCLYVCVCLCVTTTQVWQTHSQMLRNNNLLQLVTISCVPPQGRYVPMYIISVYIFPRTNLSHLETGRIFLFQFQ